MEPFDGEQGVKVLFPYQLHDLCMVNLLGQVLSMWTGFDWISVG